MLRQTQPRLIWQTCTWLCELQTAPANAWYALCLRLTYCVNLHHLVAARNSAIKASLPVCSCLQKQSMRHGGIVTRPPGCEWGRSVCV